MEYKRNVVNLFNLEQIQEFVQPLEASEEQKNEYINLESTLSLSCVYLACKWLIAENREKVFYSDYVNNEISESVFRYESRPISIGEELLLTESIIYLSQQTTSSGNIRYEIADAFIHSTGEDGQTHFINLLKKEFLRWFLIKTGNKIRKQIIYLKEFQQYLVQKNIVFIRMTQKYIVLIVPNKSKIKLSQ